MGTLLGWTGLGFGVIILYGAVKGVSVFGKDGIITNAITEGKLTHVVSGKVTTSGGKDSTKSKLVKGVEAGAQGPAELNHAVGNVGKSIGNGVMDKLGLGGVANGIEHLPVIGRIINDGGNIFQAGQEIGQNAGRSVGKTVGHDIAQGAKDIYHGAGSYLHSLKGIF